MPESLPESTFFRLILAGEHTQQEQEDIVAQFSAEHGLSNESFEISSMVNPQLKAGYMVYYDGHLYDYSVRTYLRRVQESVSAQMAASVPVRQAHDDPTDAFDASSVTPEDLVARLRSELHGAVVPERLEAEISEAGLVMAVADGIAEVQGLEHCASNEVVRFDNGRQGLALNLHEGRVSVAILGGEAEIGVGHICRRSGRALDVPVGDELIGRVVNALGETIDGLEPLEIQARRPIEFPSARVIDRAKVTRPLYTGITSIDAMTPIGRGQRELIIGDRGTGKSSIALDTIYRQKDQNVLCVYVAIGQKLSTVANVVNRLRQEGALAYTTVVVASAADSAALQYVAPYAATAIAEHWMYEEQRDVLIVYDDLTKHAQSYRALSLLLRRPPGREAYPGDIFYLHSRLLERAAQLGPDLGGGSITALPIVETQSGDISAYVPTNIISITDGQIYLASDLFFAGQRPAINVGLSVSRVGGDAQIAAMRQVAGRLRASLAQYNEVAAFSRFGTDLEQETRDQLRLGDSLLAVLVQARNSPRTAAESIILLDAAMQGYFNHLEPGDIRSIIPKLLAALREVRTGIRAQIRVSGDYTPEVQAEARAYVLSKLETIQAVMSAGGEG